MTKTILKWAGNKSKVMQQIKQHFPLSYNRYLEPFAGSLGSFLHSGVTVESHLNDLNSEILNLFECVRDDYKKVVKLANAFERSKDAYYKIRARDKQEEWLSEDRFLRAARTVYINKMCFNGLYRVNRSGYFNVPYGSGRKGEVLPEEEAKKFSEAIKNANFYCKDYKEFLKIADAGDLLYLDPPYVDVKEPKKEFNGYVGGFGWTQQLELIEECKKLKELGCTILVSNSHCKETLDLYKDFEIFDVIAPRYISCKKDGRKPVKEILAKL